MSKKNKLGGAMRLAFRYDSKLQEKIREFTVICSCSCRVKFLNPHKDEEICYWCHRKVYRNKKAEFKAELKEHMKCNCI